MIRTSPAAMKLFYNMIAIEAGVGGRSRLPIRPGGGSPTRTPPRSGTMPLATSTSASQPSDRKPTRRKRRLLESQDELRERFSREEAHRRTLVRTVLLDGDELEILERHREAVDAFRLSYEDPGTGLKVLTAWNHFVRGACCGSACRHCIYGHAKVQVEKRREGRKVFNTAFWTDRKK